MSIFFVAFVFYNINRSSVSIWPKQARDVQLRTDAARSHDLLSGTGPNLLSCRTTVVKERFGLRTING
jgi:hypothetical protein